ncbi:competence protein ComEC [Actinoplanes sp. SE50]|uniref:ComEC/Rec2 family competence protein n=1 Tax=unclassified Actinoplanes TaxID=2626549 RepID=UPI00023EBB02|nr:MULTISPECIES: ComEC/Rec2 family competence protein [unclassified Actinoplanes]AEV82288.1 ComE operon protein 3 [Actinoplanes sp. SE50/110]ATO80685.1 competence protein ComEC [Actinoplanes sp. SE50]SLL98092.1 competence protein ComEC [Actinoplanes sp. SE50/110]
MAGVWLAALGALHLPARGGLLVGGVALLVAGTCALAGAIWWTEAGGRAPGRGRAEIGPALGWIVIALALGAGCGAVATAARLSVREARPLAGLIASGEPVEVRAVVRDDPRALRGAAGPPTYLLAVDLETVRVVGSGMTMRLSARALVLGSDPGWRGLLPGQEVTAAGKLLPPRPGDLRAAVVAVRRAPRLIGEPSWAQRAAGVLRAGLQRACAPLPADSGGLLPGLVVGDTSRLDPGLETDFQTAGMTHLTAVSGANVAMILGVVLFAVRRTRAGPVLCAAVCGVALAGFVILARPSPSVVRAAAMGAIGLLGLASGRPRVAVPALAAAVAVLLLADPELAADPGFTLSVLATGGLLLLAPAWREALRARGWPAGAAEALAVPAAAQVACGPVIAGLSGTVSLVAVPANLMVVPAIAPATLLGVAAALLSPVWPAGAGFAAWLAHWPAEWLVLVARTGARVPAGALPWPAGVPGALLLAGLTVAFLIAARRAVVRRLAAVVAACAVLGALPVRLLAPGWPPPHWLVVACSVGQGDAVVLPAGTGRAVVVDAGPDPDPVDRCLRRLGVRQVALFVVSHYHADHVGGVDGVFRGRAVAAVVAPDWPEPAGGRRQVAEAARAGGTPVLTVGPGWAYEVGGVRLVALGPVEPLRGTNSDPNNNSLVLRATLGGRTVLLPGDAETEEQNDLVARVGAAGLRADVLKVAHHGSALQSPELLTAVDPAVALVSVGVGNDYGHPNLSLLARLARDGARVMRTDESGDLAVVTQVGGLAVTARGVNDR